MNWIKQHWLALALVLILLWMLQQAAKGVASAAHKAIIIASDVALIVLAILTANPGNIIAAVIGLWLTFFGKVPATGTGDPITVNPTGQ